MKHVLPVVVFALMVAIGMSLRPGEVAAHLKRIRALQWVKLLVATFLAPPVVALLLGSLFGLRGGELAGLFLIAVVPGAPLVSRNAAKRGFDLHLAAAYQIWCALLVPVMVPFTVYWAGRLYHKDFWIAPEALLRQIAGQQFLPLLIGAAVAALAPRFAERAALWIGRVGSLALMAVIVLFLFKLGPQLKEISPLVFGGSALLAASALGIMLWLGRGATKDTATLGICNANRHIGLALLMAGNFLHIETALPAVAAYALMATLVMTLFAAWVKKTRAAELAAPAR